MLRDMGQGSLRGYMADKQVTMKEWPEYFCRRWMGRWQGLVLSIMRRASFLLCFVGELGWEGTLWWDWKGLYLLDKCHLVHPWDNSMGGMRLIISSERWGELEEQKVESHLFKIRKSILGEMCERKGFFFHTIRKDCKKPTSSSCLRKTLLFFLSSFYHLPLCEPYKA